MHSAGEFALIKMGASASSHFAASPHHEGGRGLQKFKSEQGSSLVEYALMFLAFMMMIFGIAAAGAAAYAYHFVSHASREASRWAAVNGANCHLDSSCTTAAAPGDVHTFVINIVPAGIDSTQVNVATDWPATSGLPAGVTDPCASSSKVPGCPVQVTVTYVFHFPVPLFPTTSYTLSSTSQMIIAH